MKKEQSFQNSIVPLGFRILWVVAVILWAVFVAKGMITEMWVANTFMFIGVFGGRRSKNSRAC